MLKFNVFCDLLTLFSVGLQSIAWI